MEFERAPVRSGHHELEHGLRETHGTVGSVESDALLGSQPLEDELKNVRLPVMAAVVRSSVEAVCEGLEVQLRILFCVILAVLLFTLLFIRPEAAEDLVDDVLGGKPLAIEAGELDLREQRRQDAQLQVRGHGADAKQR